MPLLADAIYPPSEEAHGKYAPWLAPAHQRAGLLMPQELEGIANAPRSSFEHNRDYVRLKE